MKEIEILVQVFADEAEVLRKLSELNAGKPELMLRKKQWGEQC